MRKERYDKLLSETTAELFTKVHYMNEGVSGEFETRHDGPFTLKAVRRGMKRSIKEYRKQCAALLALKKQIAQPVMYRETARETKEYCPNCYEEFEDKEWHYEYCPCCGQRLEWSDKK